MRHGKKFNHLSRTSAHRKAMLANMSASLILHKRINTTLAKAKALRVYIEPLITRSKDDSTHSRRVVFSYLQSKEAVTELFREISQKVANRPGGYTRILKTGNRLGDNAEMCFIELVDYNENLLKDTTSVAAKPSRRRRGGKKTTDVAAVAATDAVVEEAKEDVVADETTDEVIVEETAEVQEDVVEVAKEEEVKEVKEETPKAVTEEKEEEKTEEPTAEEEETKE